ncbi:50S ribosomal protein L18e [Candidatus Woesearchaeota archaeon]|nr:50S ribosomal protein L18e [Candidatus Woesearchaeota archaeon]
MRTGPSNPGLRSLIDELRKKAFADKTMLWKRLAVDLEKPTRQRREINLSRISRYTKDGETIVVPGKVLAGGDLQRKVTIAAWQFSQGALEKIQKAEGKAISIPDLMKDEVKGKRIRIMV